MDAIEDSPVNEAHYFCRKADKLARKGLFDDACEYHEKAACSLIKALTLSANKLALESLELQIKYHVKKKDILRLKKLQHLAVQEVVRVQKEAMSRVMKTKKKTESGDGDETLQKAIYRTFEEADSLLELLVHKKDTGDKITAESAPVSCASGSKRPKDDTTVIEELRIVNYQLRSLITQLMTELAAKEEQVATLKGRVAELERSGSAIPAIEEIPQTSSCDELAAELPPLELPYFETK